MRTTPETFWKKFKPAPAPEYAKHLGDCWLWQGASKENGNGIRYGVTSVNYKQWYTHRLAYFYTHGEIPAGLQIRHACDVGICGRPEHLSLGTAQDNADDRVKRNRQAKGEKHSLALAPNRVKGEKHFRARFTETSVREIRKRFASGESTRQIAASLGESFPTIYKIVSRQRWKHVE